MKTGLNDKLAFEIQKRYLPLEMKDKELAQQQREIENLREVAAMNPLEFVLSEELQ